MEVVIKVEQQDCNVKMTEIINKRENIEIEYEIK